MRVLVLSMLVLVGSAEAASAKDTRFWNLTANTVTHLQFSAPGKGVWGPDQCQNDKDGSVDHDERLKIVGVKTGVHDAKVSDATRTCIVKNVAVTEGQIFSIDEKAMTDCK